MPAPEGPAAAVLGGAFGFGVFAMTRKQMLGIRDRAEAAQIAAGITAEFTGRWDEKVAEAADTAVEAGDATVVRVADAAAEAAEKVAEAADTAVETARVAKPAVRKAARKAARAVDKVEPTV
jgi:hypothetical protein